MRARRASKRADVLSSTRRTLDDTLARLPGLGPEARALLSRPGRLLRPRLVGLSARVAGGATRQSRRLAALLETLHLASLLHDDVIDDDDVRRGAPSLRRLAGNRSAVLTGDALLAGAVRIAAGEPALGRVLAAVVEAMATGAALEDRAAREGDLREETYFTIARLKTAALFAACCGDGAATAGAPPDLRRRLRRFGEHFGLAYQIGDDLADDLDGRGNDAAQGRATLPLILALEQAAPGPRRTMLGLLARGRDDPAARRRLREAVAERGGIAAAQRRLARLASSAARALAPLPRSRAREELLALAAELLADGTAAAASGR